MTASPSYAFLKMHGLGNDFVIFDGTKKPLPALSAGQVRALSHRQTGIGCDQLIVLEPSRMADCTMRIFNADGSEVNACGNATRCVAAYWLTQHPGATQVSIETGAGILYGTPGKSPGTIVVNMGPPVLDWEKIPLSHPLNILDVDLAMPDVPPHACAIGMGNPHIVFFVTEHEARAFKQSEAIEHHALFPERVNVSWVVCKDRENLHLKTWERGAGATLACGTAACASMVAARLTGRCDPSVTVHMPGGSVRITWPADEAGLHSPLPDLWMEGPVSLSFTGILPQDALGTDG
jgi:diaminopimelate epimerase